MPLQIADCRLAWWRLRGRPAVALLLVLCIAIGVAARVAIGAFVGQLESALQSESQTLLLADIEISGRQALSEVRQEDLVKLLPAGSRQQQVISTRTMAASHSAGRSQVVLVLAVQDAFPFYGQVQLRDAQQQPADIQVLQGDDPAVYVQPDLLVALQAQVGDTIRLGGLPFRVVGTIADLPGLGFGGFAIGPRVLIAYDQLHDSGLLSRGSRSQHRHLLALPPGHSEQAPALADTIREYWRLPKDANRRMTGGANRQGDLRVRSAEDAAASIRRGLDRMGDFMILLSMAGILFGGLGVAAVVNGLVESTRSEAAMLQVLGASPRRVLLISLVQILVLTVFGALLGVGLGALGQWGMAWAVQDMLPIQLSLGVPWRVVVMAIVLGLVMAVLFTWSPLLRLARLRPLAVMRGESLPPGPRMLVAIVLITVVFWLVMALDVQKPVLAALVLLGVLVMVLVFAGLAQLVLPLLGRLPVRAIGWRYGLRNVRRHRLRQLGVIIPLALGLAIMVILLIHRASLLGELAPGLDTEQPSLFVVNALPDDVPQMQQLLQDKFSAALDMAPVVRARLRSVAGRSVQELAGEDGRSEGLLLREQNLSYREEAPPGGVLAGKWMTEVSDLPEGVGQVSLEEDFAESIGAGLGDDIVVAVMGLEKRLRVTSLRRVDWSSFRPNFFMLVDPASVQDDPAMWLGGISVADPKQAPHIQAALVEALPAISVFDIASVVSKVRGLLDRIALAVAVLAVFAVLAGLVVLAAVAVQAARERRQEAALLRVLGAGDKVLLQSLAIEFASIAVTAAGISCLLVIPLLLIGQEAAIDLPVVVPGWHIALLVALVVCCVTIIGVVASRRVLREAPLQVLRGIE